MAAKTMIEIVILVDSEGKYAVGLTRESAVEQYEEEIQEMSEANGLRFFNIQLTVPLPVPVQVAGEVEKSEEAVSLKVNS